MTIKVFAEYRVPVENVETIRGSKAAIISKLKAAGAANVRLFRGPDQPGLLVEDCDVADMETYIKVKKMRDPSDPSFDPELHRLVGEPAKISIWAFEEM